MRALKQSDYFTEWDNSQERNVMDSKVLAANAHKILKEMGHKLPLGHVYELFSKLSGHKSWNVAKTKDNAFAPVIQTILPNIGSGNYEVKVVIESGSIELKKYYRVEADSEKEAEHIVNAYIKYRTEQEYSYLDVHEGVSRLAEQEDEEEFFKKNWEVIWNEAEPKIQQGSTWKVLSRDELISQLTSFKISPEELRKQLK